MKNVGIVIIGRNEGARLKHSLKSVNPLVFPSVYVDSNSIDQSIKIAKSLQFPVIELNSSLPLNASRARNVGFRWLMEHHPEICYVQFVDGDSVLVENWIPIAYQTLESHPEMAIICGNVREKDPDYSIYNKFCELEWRFLNQKKNCCGGILMTRAKAFQEVDGFNINLIAGEEKEFCLRIQQQGWKVARLSSEMAIHDAAISKFSQWWTRGVRCGYSYVYNEKFHTIQERDLYKHESRSIWFWGFLLPISSLLLTFLFSIWSLLLFCLYLLLIAKIFLSCRRLNWTVRDSLLYAFSCLLLKFPHLIGMWKYYLDRIKNEQPKIIDYK